ncbi:MAG TPA: hypothetical protein VHN98_03805 [Acidimicrobiales bacterium]|nr:hypothetical protein [Acidimicrobiales bacterium]
MVEPDNNYDNADDLDAEGIPVLDDNVDDFDGGIIPPREHPRAVDSFGTTQEEERLEESVEERARQERPDVDEDDVHPEDADASDEGRPLVGRIVEPGSYDVDEVDDEKDAVGMLYSEDEGSYSAEEAALHTTENP